MKISPGTFLFSASARADWSTTEIAERLLPEYKLNRFQVLRRISQMNKRLQAEMDRPVAESREDARMHADYHSLLHLSTRGNISIRNVFSCCQAFSRDFKDVSGFSPDRNYGDI